ncbi:hypothetical protein O1611_g6392 [Lasiodiplodia mahajangana]|uniref:Uncharacterized protein n=1 Tax=Lasiodiplodia mahajangana TaxID=1108764 RepID=A0ACC2JIP1_9PEZI|nr:hypothetical protein O1611_g6392 [Lasiodiplodia mahajangana]
MMAGRVFKARRPQPKLSKNLQQHLLDVLARTEVEAQSNSPQQPPAIEDLNCNALVVSSKRPFDATSVTDSVPAKRPRLTRTGPPSSIAGKTAEQQEGRGAHTRIQQPTPRRPKHSYALFLENFADLADPVVSWLESSGDIRCRSDSHLYRSSHSPISRPLTISVLPEMGRGRDTDGFAVPPTPPLPESPSEESGTQSNFTGDSTRSSKRSLVEDPDYRRTNLTANHIYMPIRVEKLPDHISALVDDMRKDRGSPEPTLDEVSQDRNLATLGCMGAGEQQVEKYFNSRIFPLPDLTEPLHRSDKQPMLKRAVPTTSPKHNLSNPVPDILYGYNLNYAFPSQQLQLSLMVNEAKANNYESLYPFLVVEFKGEGPSGSGNLWVAANQCVGGSVSSVNIAERLNQRLEQLRRKDVELVNSAAFGVVMDGTDARVYVSWKQNKTDFYMQCVEYLAVQNPSHYLLFRRYIRNIIGWGMGERLQVIRKSLDLLPGGKGGKTSGVAKSDPPASPSSSSENTKRHKSSPLSALGDSRTNSIQGRTRQSSDAESDTGDEK